MRANLNDMSLTQQPIDYRNWLISSKLINGQLWLRWQHPKENFPRYSYPVGIKGLTESLDYVRLLIDISIKLEQGNSDN